MTDPEQGYLLTNQRPEAGDRFRAMSALFDPWTQAHLQALGLGPGWRCWEVGAGSAPVPRWLAARVGARGRVLATDIDLTWLDPGDLPGVETRRHDVAADPPPDEQFDLVHARLVLVHLPDRARVLTTLAAALRPSGWLVVEDADPALQPLACPDEAGPDELRANRLRTAFRQLLAARGADIAFGRRLPGLLRGAGLRQVAAEVCFPLARPEGAVLELATIAHVRADLVAAGLAAEEEIDAHVAAVAAGRLDLTTAPLVTAWGRRPG